MNQRFLVTMFSETRKQVIKSNVWDPSQPFTIGYPIQWVLSKTATGVQLRSLSQRLGDGSTGASPTQITEMSFSEIEGGKNVPVGKLQLHITPIFDMQGTPTWIPKRIPGVEIDFEESENLFKKAFYGSLLGAGLFLMICFFWPRPRIEPDEVIPPQFAKLLLTPAFQKPNEESQSSKSAAKRETSIVQAFQSQQVKKSAQKLIHSGRLALLAKSNLLSGTALQDSVNNLFKARSKDDLSTIKDPGSGMKALTLSTLGGDAEGKAKGDVGYGHGKKAELLHQGGAVVSFDETELKVEEGLTMDEVGKVIHAHMKEIRYCYESAILKEPNLQGKILVSFIIQSTGLVKRKTASVKDSKLSNMNLSSCVIRRLETWKFPKPKGGVDVEVSYPFVFQILE